MGGGGGRGGSWLALRGVGGWGGRGGWERDTQGQCCPRKVGPLCVWPCPARYRPRNYLPCRKNCIFPEQPEGLEAPPLPHPYIRCTLLLAPVTPPCRSPA